MKNCLITLLMLISFGTSFAQNYIDKGYEAYKKSDYDNAITYYNLAIESEPNNASIYNLRGNVYYSKSDFENAIKDYSKSIELKSDLAVVYINRGSAFVNKGEYTNAIIDFTYAIKLDPNNATTYNKRGLTYSNKKEYNLAIEDFTKAIELKSDEAEFYYNRALVNRHGDNFELVINDYNRAIQLNNKNDIYFTFRGNYLKKNGFYIKAIEDYSKAIEIKESKEKLKTRSELYLLLLQYDLAIKDINRALQISENIDLKDFILTKSNLYFFRGYIFNKRGDYEKAIKDYTEAINQKPREIDYYLNRGKTYIKNGKQNLAVIDFQHVVDIDSNKTINSSIALFYLNRKIEAENISKTILEATNLNKRSTITSNDSDIFDAKAYLSKVRTRIKYYDLSKYYAIINNKSQAINCLKNSIDFGFDDYLEILINEDFENIVRMNDFKKLFAQLNIKTPDYLPETDENVPLQVKSNPNLYALIIGNEDYQSYQTGLSQEINVKYAENDARIFKEYVIKTLGAPERNTCILINATGSRLMQEVEKLTSFAEVQNGKAEIIFYYAGHGLASNDAKEPFLIPVDVDGSNLKYAIKLQDVIDKLSLYPTKRTTVFLDACFSGGARGQELISMRGVKVRPKENLAKGNLVIFASSSETQPSQSYDEMKHGLFTYFLLKKIQETKGNVNYAELFNYLKEQVSLESLYNKSQKQTPTMIISSDVQNNWGNWKLSE